MAKITIKNLGLGAKKVEPKIFGYNGYDVEVKQYLSMQEKMDLIASIVEKSLYIESRYINYGRTQVITDVDMLLAYTNISITDKQREDYGKLYDIFSDNNFMKEIFKLIPTEEIEFVRVQVELLLEQICKYQNSANGLLEMLQSEQNQTAIDMNSVTKQIQDKTNIEFLSEIMEKMPPMQTKE